MRRRFGYLLAWALATVVAVTGAWIGLQPLRSATSPELPTRLSAAQLRQAAPASPSLSPSPPPRSPSPASPTRSPTPAPAPSHTPHPSPTPSPPAPSATLPAQPVLPVTSQWQPLPDGERFARTFVVRGGVAVFRAGPEKVEVLAETANPGYEVAVHRWSRRSVIISFESEDFTSRIWVMWRNQQPYAEVTESV